MNDDALTTLLRELEAMFAPLLEAGQNRDLLFSLLRRTGWTLANRLPDVTVLASAFADIRAATDAMRAVVAGSEPDFAAFARALQSAERVPRAVDRLASTVSALAPAAAAQSLAQLPADLLELLFLDWLKARSPMVDALFRACGFIEAEQVQRVEGDSVSGTLREPIFVDRLKLEKLPAWITDPAEQARQRFGMASVVDDATAGAYALRVFPFLSEVTLALGGRAVLGRGPAALRRLSAEDELALAQMLRLEWELPDVASGAAAARGRLGAILAVVPPDGSRPAGLSVAPYGGSSFALRASGWTGTLDLQAATEALEFRATGTELPTSSAGQFDGNLSVRRTSGPLQFGNANGTRFEIGSMALTGSMELTPQARSFALALDLQQAALVIAAGDGDGFLSKVLPPDAIVSRFDFGLSWSNLRGFTFTGSAGLSARFSVERDLAGILRIHSLWLNLSATSQGGAPVLLAEAALTGAVTLGPLSATIDRMGLRLGTTFPRGGGNAGPAQLTLGFKPPSGVAIKIDSGPVKGGGFIAFEPEIGQYSGALQLSIKAIDLSAIALINTRLPDRPDGYSFLVILAAQFPSIPLGFGFALQGVGGIVGIHRRMDTQALKQRVSEGVLGSILFPRDPVRRIETVLSDLRSIFPIHEGRFVFGPMVKLTWGPSALLSMELAVVLDLPSPLRLAILGRMRLVLPTVEEAIADIRLEVAGILDFDRQEASVTAALVDSRLAGFTLTGDMAMFLGWGASKAFSLSMGGFFPGFPVPAGMPRSMRRLALALSSGDNPRLRFESYFAVTSNTVQFGARVELYAAVDAALGTFAVSGLASFDALIQFEPFQLLCKLLAELAVSLNGVPILMARLQAQLSGPQPWHAVGYAEFQFGIKVRVPFEITVGEAIAPAVEEIDLRKLLQDELTRKESWAGVPVPEAGSIATLREAAPGDGVVLHPLGSLALVQRLLPFEKTLNRFGAARPAGGPAWFRLAALHTGGVAGPTPRPVLADFAPGQFDDLTEDEKLSRPAFEAMPAGGAAEGSAFGCGGRVTPVSMSYREIVLDLGGPAVDEAFIPALLAPGRADAGLSAVGSGIQVAPERYIVVDAHTLGRAGGHVATSAAQAHDVLRSLSVSARAGQVVMLACEAAP